MVDLQPYQGLQICIKHNIFQYLQAVVNTHSSILVLGPHQVEVQGTNFSDPGALVVDAHLTSMYFVEATSVTIIQTTESTSSLRHNYLLTYKAHDSKDRILFACKTLLVTIQDSFTNHHPPRLNVSYKWKDNPQTNGEQLAISASCSPGAIRCTAFDGGIIEDIVQNTPWVHCESDFIGKSGTMGAYGVRSVNSAKVTHPQSPYRIVYSMRGGHCNNESPDFIRLVRVVCPKGYKACHFQHSYCTPLSVCAFSLDLLFSVDEDGGISDQDIPKITLVGDSIVEIPQHTIYPRCPLCLGENFHFPIPCDKGATAWDDLEGDLTDRIEVCKARHGDTPALFHEKGITECAIDTKIPGIYEIAFSVKNSAGYEASVTRILKVLPDCSEDEYICEDFTCSDGTVCNPATEIGVAPQNEAITLELKLKGTSTVEVPYGELYAKCTDNENQEICDEGAIMVPNDDQAYRIHACADSVCVKNPGICEASLFETHGLQACQLNTSTEIGSVVPIVFTAINENPSLPSASITRFLKISNPCGYTGNLCGGVCVPMTCEMMQETLKGKPPEIQISSKYWRAVVPFGVLMSGWHLLCSGYVGAQCLVSAWDPEDGDLSHVVEATAYGDPVCHPSHVFSGVCPPGRYMYMLFITDADSNKEQQMFEVNIVEMGVLDVSVEVYPKPNSTWDMDSRSNLLESFAKAIHNILEHNLFFNTSQVHILKEDIYSAGDRLSHTRQEMRIGLVGFGGWVVSFFAGNTSVDYENINIREGVEAKLHALDGDSAHPDPTVFKENGQPHVQSQSIFDIPEMPTILDEIKSFLGRNAIGQKSQELSAEDGDSGFDVVLTKQPEVFLVTHNRTDLDVLASSIRGALAFLDTDQNDLLDRLDRLRVVLGAAANSQSSVDERVKGWMIAAIELQVMERMVFRNLSSLVDIPLTSIDFADIGGSTFQTLLNAQSSSASRAKVST